MTVKITKPALNLREELADLRKPSGIAGEAVLRADTTADAREAVELSNVADSATGVDVSGTVTADGLTVDGGSLSLSPYNTTYSNNPEAAKFESVTVDTAQIHTDLNIYTKYNNILQKRMSFNDDGDISFYDDTGSSAKFHWDATDERLGIGTNAPSAPLSVKAASNAYAIRMHGRSDGYSELYGASSDGATAYSFLQSHPNQTKLYTLVNSPLLLGTNGSERMRIDSSGDIQMRGKADVRLTLGSNGTVGNNTSNWIRGDDNQMRFNSISDGYLFETNGAAKMTIDSSGEVGIGCSPAARLHVDSGTNDAAAYFDSTSVNGAHIRFLQDGYVKNYIGCGGGIGLGDKDDLSMRAYDNLIFATGNTSTPRMTINSSGDVLVGGTSENAEGSFTIRPNTSNGSCMVQINRDDTTATSNAFVFYNEGTGVGAITYNNTATSYNTSSDYRLKEDWQPVANASDRLMALNPVNFAWKADGSRVDGFLAHEAQEVVPEAVSGTKDAMRTEEYEVTPAVYEDVVIPAVDEVLDEDGNVITEAQEERTEQNLVSEAVMGERDVEDYQGIDQSKLVPLLTAALQEALARIEALENK